MLNSARVLLLCGSLATALAWTGLARAECGGQQQCIAVSIDAAVRPEHGTPLISDPMAFGNQPVSSESPARTIYVRAVTGPAGTFATLDSITLGGANAGDFRVTGGTCPVGTPSLPQDGASCTITVVFNPTSVGTRNASVAVQTTFITRTVPLTGVGTTPLPTATPVTMSAQASTPTTIDLANYIGGTGTLSVRITATPSRGTAVLSGTRVTYTPAAGYLGPDVFSYDVTGDSGTSAPAAVTITVVPRPDPTADPSVVGSLRAQAQTTRRFARAQIVNIQSRLESLHRLGADRSQPSAGVAERPGAAMPKTLVAGTTLAFDPLRRTESDAVHLPPGLVPALAAATRSGAFNAGALGTPVDRSVGATGVWVGGHVQFGTRDQTSDSSGLRFSTDGLSTGVDRRISDRLALGIAAGYAQDQTDIGSDGTKTRAKGSSIAIYGSYQPSLNTYIDSLLGYGTLDLDSDRFVAAANDFARGKRDANQWFGSIAAGYEYRQQGVLLSPYGRLDFGQARLKQYTESGAGLAALTYFEQTLPSLQLSIGMRAESMHETDFGWALPRLRVEFRHDFKGESQATLAYADLPGGPLYGIAPAKDKRASLLLGLGSDFILRNGLKLGVDYQIQRASGVDHNQLVRLWISKELDGKGLAMSALDKPLFANPVRVEAAIVWDDNVNRARDADDKLADRVYSLNVGKSAAVPLSEHTRLIATGFGAGDKFVRYPGLDRFTLGGQAELQYRASGEFSAPTFGLQGRLTFDEHAGQLRSGRRYSLALTYRHALTDRIELFGALAANRRKADDAVFDGKDTSVRLNVDYALTHSGVLYVGGEYRDGDLVSTLLESPAYASFAKAFVRDDGYGSDPRFAYRYDAKTTLWTLGYNWALGPRDSLDFSLRRAASKPAAPASPVYGAQSKYTANQFSLAYLMRF